MKSEFRIYIKPEDESSINNISLFELRSMGISKSIKYLINTNKYEKLAIVENDKNGSLFNDFLFTLLLVNIRSKIVRNNGVTLSYFNRLYSLIRLSANYVNLLVLAKKTKYALSKRKWFTSKNASDISDVIYLKTNLSFGVRAGGSIGHISGVVNALNKTSKIRYISSEEAIMIDTGVDVVDVALDKVNFSMPYELNSLRLNKEYIEASKSQIDIRRPKAIYQRLTLHNYTGAFISKEYDIPLIVEYNGSEVWVQNNWGNGLKYSDLALDIENCMLSQASKVITVSKVLVDELIKRGVDESKIVYYPNCIDPKIYDDTNYSEFDKIRIREEIGLSSDDFLFTFIGTFGRWHGIEFLANTIKNFIDSERDYLVKNKIRFLLIGDGLLSNTIRSTLSEPDYRDFTVFTGVVAQDKAPYYLHASNAFLSPHIKQKDRFIGSPTKLFEYMAFSKPIIASDLEQIGEVLSEAIRFPNSDSNALNNEKFEDKCALLFEPNNNEAFIKAMKYVIENQSRCKVIGKNAKVKVMKNFTWDIHVSELLK